MKRILVPTDFSQFSEHATEVAFQIAKKKKMTIHFLHSPEDEDKKKLDSEAKFKELIKTAKRLGVAVETFSVEGFRTHKVITSHAKKHNSDIIIMGSHGLTPGESQFLGSNAQRVVRKASCPVLTIKKSHASFSMKRIVYASSFNYRKDKMFDKIIEIAVFFGSQIELVYINTPENFMDSKTSYKKMASFVKQHTNVITNINVYNDHNTIDGILNFSKHINADIIAMSTLGKTGLHRFLEASITESIVNFSKLPVLSLCSSEILSRKK